MAPIVAPNVARFSLIGSYADQPVATVLDIQPAIVTGSAPDRASFLSLTSAKLNEAWLDMVFPFSQSLEYTGVNYVDLDTADGLVGGGTFNPPLVGTGQESAMPGNVAVRFNKQGGGFQRGQRAGRLYMAGCLEGWTTGTDPSVLGSVTTTLQAGADAFMGALAEPINDPVGGGSFALDMVVVHTTRPTPDADPVYTGKTSVTSLVIQTRLASQRRRLDL